jgi:hypothetical protein
MTDWKVQPEMHHSDHHLLTVNLPVTPDRMPLPKGRHLRKADWKAFTRLVNTAYEAYSSPVLWSVQEIDRATSHLHTAITAALDEIAPIVPYRPKKSVFSWWNADLEDLKKRVVGLTTLPAANLTWMTGGRPTALPEQN